MTTNTIQLPNPETSLSFPLMQAIKLRRTKRKWANSPISIQEISNILWVACGITQKGTQRAKSKRTVPSACNSQEVKVYIALETGLYLYNEYEHQLVKVLSEDIRSHIGTQKMMRSAPVGLIYVSDFTKMKSFVFRNDEQKWMTSAVDVGFISQNVYLYCAAARLSTAILGLVPREKLQQMMRLNEHEKIVYTQVIGRQLLE